jgi:hypothetical protein
VWSIDRDIRNKATTQHGMVTRTQLLNERLTERHAEEAARFRALLA